jgi:hypothetical protein
MIKIILIPCVAEDSFDRKIALDLELAAPKVVGETLVIIFPQQALFYSHV